MVNRLPRLSLASQPLRRKLVVSFILMAVIPVLVFLYLLQGVFTPRYITIMVLLLLWVIILGFSLAQGTVRLIAYLANEAEAIAKGDTERKIKLQEQNEIGRLATSFNLLTQRLRENMEIVKASAEETKQRDMELRRRIASLEELTVKDELTNLYNAKFIKGRLEEEVKRAVLSQRPCSYVVFNVDNFKKFDSVRGHQRSREALKTIATILAENVTEIDKAARIDEDTFALILPEKSKREAYEVSESIRKKVGELNLRCEESGATWKLTLSGGVSENPIDGMNAEDLTKKALKSLEAAKEKGNYIVA